VTIEGPNSTVFDLLLGTVQGSILGLILYAIFISPIFESEELFTFAEDNFIPRRSNSLEVLISNVEKALVTVTKWIKSFGLKVNKAKLEACLFFKKDCAPVRINMVEDTILAKKL
jgi:hypothetical protein